MVVVMLDAGVAARYCVKLIRREAYPRIATWLIFEIGVVMTLAAWLTAHDHSLVKAALNLTDAAAVTAIIAALLFEQRGRRFSFTRNEQLCLVIVGITLVAWWLTRTPWIGVAGFQIVMSVAYLPTIESLCRWKPAPPPEPIETWSVNAVAALIGVIIDLTGRRDYLAMLYPLRAFILCMIIVVLVARWRQKSKTDLPTVF